MKRLLVLFVVLFTVFFSYTIIAQEMGAVRKGVSMSFPEKVQTPLGPPLAAGTYTVGTGGNFPTIDSAFKKISVDGIAGAVTLELINTLYTAPTGQYGFFLNGPILGAGPSSRITIRPANNVAVTIQGNGESVLYFLNVSYLTLDGISLQGNTRLRVHALYNATFAYNDAIDFIGNSDQNIVQNLTAGSDDINRLPTCGIAFWANSQGASDSCLVSGVSVTSGGMGIFVGGLEPNYPIKPKGNVLRGNHIGSPSDTLISRGFQLEGNDGTVVENNDVDNLKLKLLDSGNNLYLIGINAYICINAVIRNNVVHGLRGIAGGSLLGILAAGNSSQIGQGVKIYNNMVYDLQNKSTTINGYIGGIGLWSNNNALVAYNSVSLSGTSADPTGCDALFFEGGITNATVRNNILVNIFHITATGGGCTALWFLQGTTFSSDYNDLYVDTTYTNSYLVVNYTGGTYRTLSAWQATGKDLHSYNEMPHFTSPYLHINWNYTTMIDGHATPIAGITTDFDGEPRNALTPDIGADEGVVVPVELTSFTASANGAEVILNWSTATELNNYGFEIQRKVLSGDFATVAFVKGQGTTTQQNQYSFADKNLDEGKYFYRLKQIDYGGQFSYSQTVEVDVRMLNNYTLEQNFPNPFNPTTTIGYVLQEKGNAKLTLLNSLGEEIAVLVNKEQDKGYHKVEFDASKLSSGVYFYQLRAGSFIETKKMLLLR